MGHRARSPGGLSGLSLATSWLGDLSQVHSLSDLPKSVLCPHRARVKMKETGLMGRSMPCIFQLRGNGVGSPGKQTGCCNNISFKRTLSLEVGPGC